MLRSTPILTSTLTPTLTPGPRLRALRPPCLRALPPEVDVLRHLLPEHHHQDQALLRAVRSSGGAARVWDMGFGVGGRPTESGVIVERGSVSLFHRPRQEDVEQGSGPSAFPQPPPSRTLAEATLLVFGNGRQREHSWGWEGSSVWIGVGYTEH